jgi:aspartokinase-like uncharacterized kinase
MNKAHVDGPVVIKVGGSLFDLQDLGPKLDKWLHTLETTKLILVPGGGSLADVVRELDRRHALGEEKSHRLALAAMSLAAQFLADIISRSMLSRCLSSCETAWEAHRVPILDPYDLVLSDDPSQGLPHLWTATSDSVAARIASITRARRLILLKSVDLPKATDWREAAIQHYVDPYFAELVDGSFDIECINFRQERS